MPSFRGQARGLEVPFNAQIDTELLEASMAGVERSAKAVAKQFQAASKPAEALSKSVKPTKDHTEKTASIAQRLKNAFGDVNNITSSLNNTLSLIRAQSQAVLGLFNKMQSALKFTDTASVLSRAGLDEATINRISKSLGDTVDKMRLASSIKVASDAGLTAQEIERAAQAAAFLAKRTGESKAEMFGLVTSGQLSAAQLDKVGLSAQMLEGAILKAGDGLTELDKRAISIRTVIQGAAGASNNFKVNTDQAQDAAARLFARFKNISLELTKKVLPYLNKMLGVINELIEDPKLVADAIAGAAQAIGRFIAALPEMMLKAIEGLKIFGVAVGKRLADGMRDGLSKAKAATLEMLNDLKKKTGEFVDRFRGASAVLVEATPGSENLNKSLQKGNDLLKRRRNLAQAIANEAMQEAQSLRAEARGLIRNFDAGFTDLVSNLGGSFSGVVSAMKEIPEKFRVLGSLPELRDGISKTLGMSIQQIDAQKTQLKLSNDQVKAAKLFNVALKAGKLDIEEYIGNEKAVNAQLKAGLSTLASSSKIASVLVEQNNLQKDVAASKLTIDLMSLQLKIKEREITEKLSKAIAKNDTRSAEYFGLLKRLNDNQLKTLTGAADRYKVIGQERAKILALTKQQALIEQKTELANKGLAIDKARNELLKSRAALINEIKDAGIGRSQVDIINQASAQRIREVQLALKGANIELADLQRKINTKGLIPAAELGIAKQRLQLLKDTIKAKREDITLIQGARDAQIHSLTVVGQMQQQFAETARNHNAALAGNIISMSQETIGSVGGIITSFFSDLATNQENALQTAGKAFLQVLGGMAGKLAAFYITTGIAQMFVPPYTGAGAIAAGTALAALAAGLGVASSVVGSSGASAGAGGGSSGGRVPSLQTRMPDLQRPERNEPRTEYYVINGAPFLGTDGQVARKWKSWMERQGRNMKGRNVKVFN